MSSLYILYCIVGDSTVMLQHAVQYSTGCMCNVSNNTELCLCINEFKHLLLNLHGLFKLIIVVLVCTSVYTMCHTYTNRYTNCFFS